VSFAPGPQTTWDVPAGLSELQATVAAGAGADNLLDDDSASGGAGGTVSVDLGTAYNGQTLHLLVGDRGSLLDGQFASGGEGSFIAAPGTMLVAAGGGGGSGHINAEPIDYRALNGGAGGFSTSSADGTAGQDYPDLTAAGSGATGATPGGPIPLAAELGGIGSITQVDANGVITPGEGGAAAVYRDFPTAAGGGGYAGGGGGSARPWGQPPMNAAGSGGGGSGYLAPGLTPLSTGPNTGAGFITLTYSFAPALSLAEASVTVDASVTADVSGLPAGIDFALTLSTGDELASGTTDASGSAVVPFDVPGSEGAFTVELRIDGAVVASEELTVVAAPVIPPTQPTVPPTTAPADDPVSPRELAETGVDSLVPSLALTSLVFAAGAALLIVARRGRRRGVSSER